jgi:hypothetical protein
MDSGDGNNGESAVSRNAGLFTEGDIVSALKQSEHGRPGKKVVRRIVVTEFSQEPSRRRQGHLRDRQYSNTLRSADEGKTRLPVSGTLQDQDL